MEVAQSDNALPERKLARNLSLIFLRKHKLDAGRFKNFAVPSVLTAALG
jgi:hypothetical protein